MHFGGSLSENGHQPEGFALDAATWGRVSVVLERLASSSDLAEVLNLIIDSMRDCLHAERASVFQYDDDTKELFITNAHGAGVDWSKTPKTLFRFPMTKGLAGEAATKRLIVNVPDCYADPRFNQDIDKKTGYRTRNMLTIPLVAFDGGLQGVAQVLNKDPARGPVFDAYDEQIARVLASQAAVAIRRAQSLEAEARRNKLELDLKVARTIQQSSWPKAVPQVPGYSIAARSVPAEETGGDAFDVIDLTHMQCKETEEALKAGKHPGAVLILGDATGHGIGPALSAGQFRAMVRMGTRMGCTIDKITKNLNAQLCEDLPPGRFVTAFVGHLDPAGHRIEYDAMGQAPLVLLRRDGTMENRPANGMPMGIDPDLGADPVEPFALEVGDVFVLLSDGYYEAQNDAGDQFGEERAIEAIRAASGLDAEGMLKAVDRAVDAFVAGKAYYDDRTAILVKREV